MGQSRLSSFIEAWVNVFIGFGINFVANMVILPYYGFTALTLATNLQIGLAFTVISVVRSYVVRRWFNSKIRSIAERCAVTVSKQQEVIQ